MIKFTLNELSNLDKLLGRLTDIKGTEAMVVALLLQKIKVMYDELEASEIEAKKQAKQKGKDAKPEAPKK